MKEIFLTRLRDKHVSSADFRLYANKLAYILATEVAASLERRSVTVKTPLATAQGYEFAGSVVLVPILRSGIALLYPFLDFFTNARVGFVGLRRSEETAIAQQYYQKMPVVGSNDNVIILDPMIATGGSGSAAVRLLLSQGIAPQKLTFVSVIAAPEGLEVLQSVCPEMTIVGPFVDEGLNDQKFIIPGLGDFGDRYFGTEVAAK